MFSKSPNNFLNIGATLALKFAAKNFQISPNLVALAGWKRERGRHLFRDWLKAFLNNGFWKGCLQIKNIKKIFPTTDRHLFQAFAIRLARFECQIDLSWSTKRAILARNSKHLEEDIKIRLKSLPRTWPWSLAKTTDSRKTVCQYVAPSTENCSA